MSLVASDLYGRSCTVSGDFSGVKDLCLGGMLLPFSHGPLDIVQHISCFEVFRGLHFDFSQAYLAFFVNAAADWNTDGNVGWFSYSDGDGVLSDFPAREVPGRNRSLDEEALPINTDTVMFSFLADQSLSSAVASDATTMTLSSFQKVEEQEKVDREDDIEELWQVSDLRRNLERGQSALAWVGSLCKSLSHPVPTTVFKLQQQIDSFTVAFADCP